MKHLTTIIAVGMMVLPLAVRAEGDPEVGHKLALRWCSSCHALEKAGTAGDGAPSIMEIRRRHGSDSNWMRSWLASPHPPMPNLTLTRVEIDDLVAYLEKLVR